MVDESLGASILAAGYEAVCQRASITFEAHGSAAVVHLSGEIDSAVSTFIVGNLQLVLRLAKPLVVDLSGVHTLTASGARILLDFDKKARTAGVQWALVIGDPTRQPLRIADPHGFLPLSATLADALKKVGERPRLRIVR
jgi:anti-anti-sigma factor